MALAFTPNSSRAGQRFLGVVVGPTGATGATGPTGPTGPTPGIRQAYSSTTADADPGAGTFRLNHATPASATAGYFDNADAGGATVSSLFDLIDDSTSTVKGILRIEKSAAPTAWAQFQVTGSVVDGAGYRKLTLANGAGSGAFSNGDTFAITFTRTGDKGDTGAQGPQGEPGTMGGSVGGTDNALVRADGTGGSTLQGSTVTLDDTGVLAGASIVAANSYARTFETHFTDVTKLANYGALGAGNDGTLLAAAIADAGTLYNAGGCGVVEITKNLTLASTLTLPQGVKLYSPWGNTITYTGTGVAINSAGSRNTAQSNTLASNADIGDLTVELSAGKGANFAAGDYAMIVSEGTMWTGNTQKLGEFIKIKSVATDTLTLYGPLTFGYLTADSAQVQKVTLLRDIGIEGLLVQHDDPLSSTANLIGMSYCLEPVLRNIACRDNKYAGVGFLGCIGHSIEGYRARDLLSSTALTYLGYAISEIGLNLNGKFSNIEAEYVRHGYSSLNSATLPYGVATNSKIHNGLVRWSAMAGWDTHEEALGTEFVGCSVIGAGASAFQLRGRRCSVKGGHANSCIGSAVYIPANAIGCSVDVDAYQTNLGTGAEDSVDYREYGAIHDAGIRTHILRATIYKCGGPAVRGEGVRDSVWQNIVGREVCETAATHTYAIGTDDTTATPLTIANVDVSATHSNMDYGINVASSNIKLDLSNFRIDGEQTAKLSVNNAHWVRGGRGAGMNGLFGDDANATIASGVLALNGVENGGVLFVLGEGAAADDLTSITGGTNGAIVMFARGNSGQNITFKHSASLVMRGAVDVTLDSSTKFITMIRQDNNWFELARNF